MIHDFGCHNRDGSVDRPHSSELAEVGDPRSLNPFPPVFLRAARQKGVSSSSLDYGHSGYVHLMAGQIVAKPALTVES